MTIPEPSGTSIQSGDRDALEVQIAELRELFRRRLLEDRAKNQLVQTVQSSLEARDALDRGEAFHGLFAEMLLALDRLAAHEPTAELNESVRAELLETMMRRGLRALPEVETLDTRIHEVVGVQQNGADAADEGSTEVAGRTILRVEREGYLLGDRVLRPARVVVSASQRIDRGSAHPTAGKDT